MNKKLRYFLSFILCLTLIGVICFVFNRSFKVNYFFENGTYVYDNSRYYISEREELNLEPMKLGKKIGNTSDKKSVFKIEGQQKNQYIYIIGEMEESIYRDKSEMPLTLDNIKVDKVELDGKDVEQNTTFIANLLQNLRSKDNNLTFNSIQSNILSVHEMTLISSRVKGIGYKVIILITKDNKIYLSNKVHDKIILANNSLTSWIKQKL